MSLRPGVWSICQDVGNSSSERDPFGDISDSPSYRSNFREGHNDNPSLAEDVWDEIPANSSANCSNSRDEDEKYTSPLKDPLYDIPPGLSVLRIHSNRWSESQDGDPAEYPLGKIQAGTSVKCSNSQDGDENNSIAMKDPSDLILASPSTQGSNTQDGDEDNSIAIKGPLDENLASPSTQGSNTQRVSNVLHEKRKVGVQEEHTAGCNAWERRQEAGGLTAESEEPSGAAGVVPNIRMARGRPLPHYPPLPDGWPSIMPLETMEDFEKWEKFLLNQKNFNCAVDYYSRFGGINGPEMCRRLLKKIFSPGLSSNFNLQGSERKTGLKRTATINVILGACRILFDVTKTPSYSLDKENVQAIGKWLRNQCTKKE